MSHPLLRPLEELAERWRSPEWAYAHLGPASDKPTEDICADELERVLKESGLEELLEAGQAMREAGFHDEDGLSMAFRKFDAALAKVKGKSA